MRKPAITVLFQLLVCAAVLPAGAQSGDGGQQPGSTSVRTQGAATSSPSPPILPSADTAILVVTTPSVEGYRIKEYKGIVKGVMVRQPTIGQGLSAGLERIVGGKISAYLTMCNESRQQSYDLCVEHARSLGANAVVGMAYASNAFEHGDDLEVESVCYGTAVVIEPK